MVTNPMPLNTIKETLTVTMKEIIYFRNSSYCEPPPPPPPPGARGRAKISLFHRVLSFAIACASPHDKPISLS